MERNPRSNAATLTLGTFDETFDAMPTTIGRRPSVARRARPARAEAAVAPRITGPVPAQKVAVSGEAVIVVRQGRVEVHDLGSEGGLFVNGERVLRPMALTEGDYVQSGNIELFYCESLLRRTGRTYRKSAAVLAGAAGDTELPSAEPAQEAEIDPAFLESDEDVADADVEDVDPAFLESDAAEDDADGAVSFEEIVGVADAEEPVGDDEDDASERADAPAPRDAASPRVKLLAGALMLAVVVLTIGFAFKGGREVAGPGYDESLAPALAALQQGDFDQAAEQFTALQDDYPDDGVTAVGLEIVRLFRAETDPFLFDWGKAGSLYARMAAVEDATPDVLLFARQQGEWVAREKACAGLIYQAQEHVEKKDFENALALYERIEKEHEDSDLRMAVKADLVKLRVQLRGDYVARAEQALAGKSPDWTAAIGHYENALRFFAQPDAQISEALSACKRNFDVKCQLVKIDGLSKNGKLDEALIDLDRVPMGTHYDRATVTLKNNITAEKRYQNALERYRGHDPRGALDLLAGQSDERSRTLAERIRTVVTELEEGKRLCQAREYVDALPHLERVGKTETDAANPSRQEAGQLYKQAKARILEQGQESLSRGLEAFDAGHYLQAVEQFNRLAKVDRDGSLTEKVRRKIEVEAGRLMKDVKAHFWTSAPTESDQVVLDLLIRHLAPENTTRAEALKFKNNLEEAKVKEAAKAAPLPRHK